MDQKTLEKILVEGESLTVEFKENINSDLSKEMTAFANTAGGRIFIGITDSNHIKGIQIDNSLKSQVQSMAEACDPPVVIEIEKYENILIVAVKEGKNKPYRCNKGFYKRIGANSQKLTTLEIAEFFQSEGRIVFDEIIREDLQIDKILDQELIAKFLRKGNMEPIHDEHSTLYNLSVLAYREQVPYLKNAGVLFFCKRPDPELFHCVVTCVLFKGTQRITILDKKDFFEDLVSNIDNALIFLKQHLDLRYEIKTIKREEILEIPEIALRDIVINAVCHRDYLDKRANVEISIFDDRVEVSNPGGLPKGLDAKDFGKKSITRNTLIAALLLRIGYIEKMGTGIFRIREALKKSGNLPPKFFYDTFFTVEIPRMNALSEQDGKALENDFGTISERIRIELGQETSSAFEAIIKNKFVTAVELARTLHKSDRTVENYIGKLKSAGYIKRVGPKLGGHWEIIEKD